MKVKFEQNGENKKTIEINREWLDHLAHMAECTTAYSPDELIAYILSAHKLTQDDND